jgi:hypothetical protein
VGETGTTSVWYMGSWAEGAELGRLSAWLGSFLFFPEYYFPVNCFDLFLLHSFLVRYNTLNRVIFLS